MYAKTNYCRTRDRKIATVLEIIEKNLERATEETLYNLLCQQDQ